MRGIGLRPTHVLLAVLACVVTPALAPAQQLQWGTNGGGGDGTWTADPGVMNWFDGVMNVAWDNTTPASALFGGTAGTVTIDNTFAAVQAAGLTFNTSGYILTGNPLTLTGTAPVAVGAAAADLATINAVLTGVTPTVSGPGVLVLGGSNTFTGPLTLNAGTVRLANTGALNSTTPVAVAFGSGSTGVLQLNGNSVTVAGLSTSATVGTPVVENANATAATLTVNVTSAQAFAGVLRDGTGGGALSLTKTGASTLTLGGANAYTGATTVSAGVLQAGAANVFAPSSAYTLANAAGVALDLNNTNQTIGSLAGGGGTGGNVTLGSGTLTLGGNNTSTTFTGLFTGTGTVMKVGTGTLTLRGNSTWTGPLSVTGGGVVSIDNQTRLNSSATGTITLDNGTIQETNTGNAGTFTPAGRNIVLGAGGGTLDWAAPPGNPTFLIIVQTGTVISGVGGLTKTGTGIIAVVTPATYQGPTHVVAGTLRVRTNSNVFPTTTALTVDSGATFDLGANGLNQQVGSLSGAGTVNIPGGTFTVGDATSTSFTGTITNSANSGKVTKVGSGTLTLSGNNSYTGLTTISAGVLDVQSNTALGTTAGATTVAANAALQIDGNGLNIAEPLTLNGTGVSGGGALRNLNNNNTLTGAVTLASATRINSDGGTLTLTGTVTGAGQNLTVGGAGNTTINQALGITTGSLTKDGSGTLVLGGANAYSGATTVSGGTLQAGATNVFSAASAFSLANTAGVVLDLNNANQTVGSLAGGGTTSGNVSLGSGTLTTGGNNTSTTFSGTISGTGGLTKVGTGTFTLTGANAYSGSTQVTAGTLLVNNTTGSGTGTGMVSVSGTGTVGSGGTLGGTGTINGSIVISTTTAGTQGGTLSPGASIGTLTQSGGNMTWNPNGNYLLEYNPGTTTPAAGTDNDTVTGPGALDLSNLSSATPFTMTLTPVGAATPVPSLVDYTAASFGSITLPAGPFNTVTLANGMMAQDISSLFAFRGLFASQPLAGVSGGVLFVQFTPTPEPTHLLLVCGAALGAAGWWRRRRTSAPAV
jgi:fibronectin-binding autotransporter adhesin